MKKISILAAVGVLTTAGAYAGTGNTMNNDMNNVVNNAPENMVAVMTVEQVRGLADDSPVVIQGYLLRQNGEESYIFQDSTGTINVEIDEEDWGGLTVTPNDMVEVWGEVDKNGMSMIEIDVSAIKKI